MEEENKSVGCGLPGQGKLVAVELVTDLLEQGIQRKPFHDLCNMGRERNRPKILFNYFGWRTFWYRENFGLLKSVSMRKPGRTKQGVIMLKSPISLKLGTNVRYQELT